MSNKRQNEKLERSMSGTMLAIYGAGTILGAGIFVLIGKVAGTAGYWAPLAFLLAAIAAGINGMVYAELSTRAPGAGGPSTYVQKAFGRKWFSHVIGWMIVATGVVSAATITAGFSGYLTHFIEVPEWIVRLGVLILLGGVAAAGVSESAKFMAITTSMGLIGLGIVIYAGLFNNSQDELITFSNELPALSDMAIISGVASATFLAVYSFIGFEDMVHMAEEVKQPAKSMPVAIAFAIGLAAILYVVVSAASLNVLTPEELNKSQAPLVDVIDKVGYKVWPMAILSLAIILNGALAQIIMATRVIYSMGEEEGAPDWMGEVNSKTKTPLIATIVATSVTIALALFFPLKTLASITSFIMLLVFVSSNLALIRLEKRTPEAPFDTPKWVPWVALVISILLIIASFFVTGSGH
ncbi:amino acid permease [Mangrovivirga sp. M17]|uniref:Amino acid permease n=1 Tax=Mangrovivirga halotolerans TaxID=2993936 RepID=A0ABT3RMR1_9BACT|nr:amino acid permease [Mangrovivirga halotolerans]MCX2743044.1 amino acid permease [Mangrovivirga halotolerans]